MKMYFVCENRGPEWFYCYGVLDNGFLFGEHLCSHPCFASGDLYFTRVNRINALREIFNIEPETIEHETIVVNSIADKPEWWDGQANLQEGLRQKYEEYTKLVKDQAPEIKVEFTNES